MYVELLREEGMHASILEKVPNRCVCVYICMYEFMYVELLREEGMHAVILEMRPIECA